MHPQKIFILEKILTNALEHPNSEAAKDKKGRKTVERLPDIKRNDSLSASWCSESGGSNSAVSSPLCGISDNSICSLQERDGGQYGLLDKLSLAALTKAASKCLNLDNIVIDVTRQETVWNSFRANSPHACPEACPTYFLNATRSSHRNEVSSLLADLTRGKQVSVFIWLSN